MKMRPATEADVPVGRGARPSEKNMAIIAALKEGPQVMEFDSAAERHSFENAIHQWGRGKSHRPQVRTQRLPGGVALLVSLREPQP